MQGPGRGWPRTGEAGWPHAQDWGFLLITLRGGRGALCPSEGLLCSGYVPLFKPVAPFFSNCVSCQMQTRSCVPPPSPVFELWLLGVYCLPASRFHQRLPTCPLSATCVALTPWTRATFALRSPFASIEAAGRLQGLE